MKKINKHIAIAALLTCNYAQADAQIFKDIVNTANTVINNNSNNNNGSFSNTDAVSALKEALQIGTRNASGRLNQVNGYFGNQLIKILMPPEARQIEATLRRVGMGDLVDKAILSMNRAAEDAASQAVPIFVNAITGMTIQDGISIVRGGQGAATNYLKNATTAALTSAFRPHIQNSLNKVNATRYWADVINAYNKVPMVKKMNPDLAGYVTERALNGLFISIADEENKIRTNPAARVSDILKKVFG